MKTSPVLALQELIFQIKLAFAQQRPEGITVEWLHFVTKAEERDLGKKE